MEQKCLSGICTKSFDPMKPGEKESMIRWKLPRHIKGRYVAASRLAGLPLVKWLREIADKAAEEAFGTHEERKDKEQ